MQPQVRNEAEIREKREALYLAYRDLTIEMEYGNKPNSKSARDIVNTKIGMLDWVLGEDGL